MSKDIKTANKVYEEKLRKVVEKALKYVQEPSNEDKLIKLVEVKTEHDNYVVAIGKCQGRNRPFPCIYIEGSNIAVSLPTRQMDAILRAINNMDDTAFSQLGVFISSTVNVSMRRRREVSEESEEEVKPSRKEGNEEGEEEGE